MTFGKGCHLHLIDGSAFIFRAYHALPPLTRKSDGLPVHLKDAGVWTVGLAGDAPKRYDEVDLTVPSAIVVGAEGAGYATNAVAYADDLFADEALKFVSRHRTEPFGKLVRRHR